MTARQQQDIAAIAKGGRTNFFGFLLRLVARIPFLFIAGRMYGPDALGRFAYATVIVELAAQLATLGQKRGLAAQLAREEEDAACTIADALMLCLMFSALLALLLLLFPILMFPHGGISPWERLMPIVIFPIAAADIGLAALAFRFNVKATVRARSVIEPWVLSIVAGGAWFFLPHVGLILAYVCSLIAALIATLIPLVATFGWPRGWRARIGELLVLARDGLPLAGADAIEWGNRRIDIALLGAFAPSSVVGIYYVAQQIASLPQKLKTSFEPILGPVITRNLKDGNMGAIALQVCQVGFWITAAQAGIALALGIPGEGVMGLVGPQFVGGTGAMAMLLVAEVVAATAVVSEAALIYINPVRNLMISLVALLFQAALTIALVVGARKLGWGINVMGSAAALALAISLGLSSFLKSRLLSRLLAARVNNWRLALFWAVIPASLVGWLFTRLPEWAELAFGIPAILFTYCAIIWRKGFGPEDRVLFRKSALPIAQEAAFEADAEEARGILH